MNREELLSLANKGKTEINGIPVEIIIRPDKAFGDPWIEINVEPLSPLHLPLTLGEKWVEFVTDEECEELPHALEKYKKEAEEFYKQSKTVVKATLSKDKTFYTFEEVPEKVKENFKDYPSLYKKWVKERHNIVFIGNEKKYWYAPGNFTLDLDGELFVPRWSYWLNCAYYEASDFIKGEIK